MIAVFIIDLLGLFATWIQLALFGGDFVHDSL